LRRAFVVPTVEPRDSEDVVAQELAAIDLQPTRAALLTPDQMARLGVAIQPDPRAAERSVRFTQDTPLDVRVQVGDGPAGYLVSSDTYMSGWTAAVDGAPATVLRGNLFMRVVPIPAGPTEVHFHYDTPRLGAGIGVSVLGLFGLLTLLVYWQRRD